MLQPANITTLTEQQQEAPVEKTITLVNLQGKQDCKFTIAYCFVQKPRRKAMVSGYPKTPEENLERLEDAGEPMSQLKPVCHRCGEMGHTTRRCTEPPKEREAIMCKNCGGEGHYLRDCPEPRKNKVCFSVVTWCWCIIANVRSVSLPELRRVWPSGCRLH